MIQKLVDIVYDELLKIASGNISPEYLDALLDVMRAIDKLKKFW